MFPVILILISFIFCSMTAYKNPNEIIIEETDCHYSTEVNGDCSWDDIHNMWSVYKNISIKIQVDNQCGMNLQCSDYVTNKHIIELDSSSDPDGHTTYKFEAVTKSTKYWICKITHKNKEKHLCLIIKAIKIDDTLDNQDANNEISKPTISSTSVATTHSEAATTSSTEKIDINRSVEKPDTDVETSPSTMSITSEATAYSEAATTSSTEKPSHVENMNNKWIAAAVAVPILAVIVCVLIILYKRNKLNQYTWCSQGRPQNEYDYCVVHTIIPTATEQLVYDYAVPTGPVSEDVMCENRLYTGYYSKVIPKSQRKNKSKLHVDAKPSTNNKMKADIEVDDYESINTYACPDQTGVDKTNNSKTVHSNQNKTDKADDSASSTLYASPVDKIKADADVAGYESVNALYTYPNQKSINKRKHSESFQSNDKKFNKIDDSASNNLYAKPLERIRRTSNRKSVNCNQENSNVASTDNTFLNIVYSTPLDKKETTDMDTYTNVTDGPHYSNKIGGYCVYPTYSEPNSKI